VPSSSADSIVVDALQFPVEFFPILRWLPLDSIRRARQLQADFKEVYGGFVQNTRDRLDQGEQVAPCVARYLIENQEQEKLSDTDLYMLTSVFAFGGVPSVSLLGLQQAVGSSPHAIGIFPYSMVHCFHGKKS